MILIGRYASPFVRRVGVSLNFMGIPFEHRSLSTFTEGETIKSYNPMVKVPTLLLDSGEILVDSSAILDSLCEMTPGQKILPTGGAARRQVLQQSAIMTNVLDKAVQYVNEPMKRPPEKVHQPFVDGLSEQIMAGLSMLEKIVMSGEMPGGEQATVAGITTGVGWRFLVRVTPKVALAEQFPALAAYSNACEALPAFINCQPEV